MTVKSKKIDSIKNISRLATLIGAILLCTTAFAAESSKQKQDPSIAGAATNSTAPENSNSVSVAAGQNSPESTGKKPKRLPYFAKVGDMYVSWIDYNYEYANEARQKFYHAKPSDALVASFQRQIADTLVTNAMLVQEAKRRKLMPDQTYVKQQLDQLEKQFSKDPRWPNSRPRVLPILTQRVEHESLRIELEKRVRNIPPPSTKQLRKYYDAHKDKFTAPSQPRVAVILLRVDPGAPDSDWDKAYEQGQDLVKRLRAGDEFAKLAREYSGDKTAEDGGDMGYMHEGMLPELPSETVAKLQPGETSDPVRLMEGIAIFRLIDRKQPELRSFKSVKPRVKDLWLSEQSDLAWNSLIEKLKKNTPVQIDDSHFLPLPPTTENINEKIEEKPAKSPETAKP